MTALIDAPKTAKRGDIVMVKVVFSHPMETGYRRDIAGKVIPRDIINRFSCQYDGVEVFKADLFPAIAADPFFGFTLTATRSGPVIMVWTGDDGKVVREQFTLSVTS